MFLSLNQLDGRHGELGGTEQTTTTGDNHTHVFTDKLTDRPR